jgi:hypothetical protein
LREPKGKYHLLPGLEKAPPTILNSETDALPGSYLGNCNFFCAQNILGFKKVLASSKTPQNADHVFYPQKNRISDALIVKISFLYSFYFLLMLCSLFHVSFFVPLSTVVPIFPFMLSAKSLKS